MELNEEILYYESIPQLYLLTYCVALALALALAAEGEIGVPDGDAICGKGKTRIMRKEINRGTVRL